MKSVVRISLALFLFALISAQSAVADYWSKIPHWIHFTCEQVPPGGYGYPGYGYGTEVQWEPMDGAAKYYVDSKCVWYDVEVQHPDYNRGLGGGCCYDNCKEAYIGQQPNSYEKCFQVWAYFPGEGDVEITKKASVYGLVYPGDTINYTITYKNVGSETLFDVLLIENLPSHIEYVNGGYPHKGGKEIHWNVGKLLPGQQGNVTLQVKIDENLPPTIDRIYNVAVGHPTPAPGATPSSGGPGVSSTVGVAIGLCDYLVAQSVDGDVKWKEFPAPTYKDLDFKDNVMGADHVKVNSGFATFEHTIVGGNLTLYQGGVVPVPCNLLDYPVISELSLDVGSSVHHSVGGILNTSEHVLVHSEHLTLKIHDGDYSLDSVGGIETLSVTRGQVTVIDSAGKSHTIKEGEGFTWPSPMMPAGPGPKIIGTTPNNLQSQVYTDFSVTYHFDQAVTSLSGDSQFFYSLACDLYTLSGTLDDLATHYVASSWNTEKTALTLTLKNGNPYTLGNRYKPCEVTITTQFKDVVGASGTSNSLTRSIQLFNAINTYKGALSTTYQNVAIGSDGEYTLENAKSYELEVVDLPGALPAGMRLLSPVYRYVFDGTVTSPYWISLKPTSSTRMTNCQTGGGLYIWKNNAWTLLAEGIGSTWTSGKTGDAEVTFALLVKDGAPTAPEIVSVSHIAPNDQITAANPLVIKVKSPFGIDRHLTDVRIDGRHIFAYTPKAQEYAGWTVETAGELTTLTFSPEAGWSHSNPLDGFVKVAGCYGALAANANIGQPTLLPTPTPTPGGAAPSVAEQAQALIQEINDLKALAKKNLAKKPAKGASKKKKAKYKEKKQAILAARKAIKAKAKELKALAQASELEIQGTLPSFTYKDTKALYTAIKKGMAKKASKKKKKQSWNKVNKLLKRMA